MKNYLNQTERAALVKVAILSGPLEEMTKFKLAKEEIQYFKTALTYLSKASHLLFDRLDVEFAEKVQRDIDHSDFLMVTNARGKMELEESQRRNDGFNTIIDAALSNICAKCGEHDKVNCKLRKAYKDAGVPEFNRQGRANGGCPYEILF